MAVNLVQVRHVRTHLDDRFAEHIRMDDLPHMEGGKRDDARRSRSLAALAVQSLIECTEAEAADLVTDGQDDNGNDAVAWNLDTAHLYLIQSKWSKEGTASLTLEASAKLDDGFRLITEERYEEFNLKIRKLSDQIRAVVDKPGFKVTFVFALMGDANIDRRAERPLADTVADLNRGHLNTADIKYLRVPEIYRLVADGIHSEPVRLTVHFENSGRLSEPHLAYYGCVTAEEIAGWYFEYGDRLFEKNLREALRDSPVNAAVHQTLIEEPENLWYYNNGITVLCDEIKRTGAGTKIYNGPATLDLKNASVVNGAQTVSVIAKAVKEEQERAAAAVDEADQTAAGSARVWVRVIQLKKNDEDPAEPITKTNSEDFAERITKTNNTQNAVSLRDFAALDRTQQRLYNDFKAMGVTYVIKRGERLVDPATSCDIEEAALALAAAAKTSDILVDVSLDPGRLWRRDGGGRYSQLFPSRIREIRVWRTVRLYRAADLRIKEREASLEKRAKGFVKHLNMLIAHVVLRQLIDDSIENPDERWERDVLPRVPELVDRAVDYLIAEADQRYGDYNPAALAKKHDRCRELSRLGAEFLASGRPAERLSAAYRGDRSEPRAENTVRTINNHEAVEPGTTLEFRALSALENQLINPWLDADPTRRFAAWVPGKSKVLRWQHDGALYTATGLVNKIWREASGKGARSVQGTLYWFVPGRGSLVEIAEQIRSDLD